MNMTLTFDPQRLAVLKSLIVAAGSRLGDEQAMMLAAEMRAWINQQEETAKNAPAVRPVDANAV